MTTDLGELYRAARHRVGELVSDDVSDVIVAATPMWDVHDVVAHITGVVADALSGNMEGAPGPAWTSAQVERGRGRSIAEMLAGWEDSGQQIEAVLSSPDGDQASACVVDVHCHEADLRLALGLAPGTPATFLQWASPILLAAFAGAVDGQGLPPVEVSTSPYEVFRGRLGRRTIDEVRGYRWSRDPEPYLETWFLFEPAEHSLGEPGL